MNQVNNPQRKPTIANIAVHFQCPFWCPSITLDFTTSSAGGREQAQRHPQRLTLSHALDLPRVFDRISNSHHLIHWSAGNGGHIKILAVDLVEVVALTHEGERSKQGPVHAISSSLS